MVGFSIEVCAISFFRVGLGFSVYAIRSWSKNKLAALVLKMEKQITLTHAKLRWPYQPHQCFDLNTERVALQRRLPEDDQFAKGLDMQHDSKIRLRSMLGLISNKRTCTSAVWSV